MGVRESNILNQIRLRLSGVATTFRNHVGMVRTEDGTVHRFGLCKGSSDLIGWVPVTITEDMVGHQVATFLAIEVKTPTGRASKAQRNFISQVRASGGIAFIARSPEEAISLLRKQSVEKNPTDV